MRVISQSVLAIEHDDSLNLDWNLTLQRLELTSDDVPNEPNRVGEVVDVLTLRTRRGGSGGGVVGDVTQPIDSIGRTHVVELGDEGFGVVGTARHDRYASTHVAVETASGTQHQCHMVSNADYEVDFFVGLSPERPVKLLVDISGMDYSFPIA